MWVRDVKIHVVAYKRCQLPVRVFYCSVCSLMQKVRVSDLYLGVFFFSHCNTAECASVSGGSSRPICAHFAYVCVFQNVVKCRCPLFLTGSRTDGLLLLSWSPAAVKCWGLSRALQPHPWRSSVPRSLWSPAPVVAWEFTPGGHWSPLKRSVGVQPVT